MVFCACRCQEHFLSIQNQEGKEKTERGRRKMEGETTLNQLHKK